MLKMLLSLCPAVACGCHFSGTEGHRPKGGDTRSDRGLGEGWRPLPTAALTYPWEITPRGRDGQRKQTFVHQSTDQDSLNEQIPSLRTVFNSSMVQKKIDLFFSGQFPSV